MRRKKILITGAAGYIGSVLTRQLLNRGYYIRCLDNLSFGGESLIGIYNHPRFEFIRGDIRRKDDVKEAIDGVDGVVHLAAIVGDPACSRKPEVARKTNWEGSCVLLDAAIKNNVERFLFASTCSNYGKMTGPDSYVDESSTLAPVSLYAELKVKFEKLLLEGIEKKPDFCPTSLRFATVYGISPRMRFDLTVNEFTKELACGNELFVYGEQFWRPYCHVTDFAAAMVTVLNAPKEKVAYNVFNVGDTSENYTKKMIIEELEKQFVNAEIKRVKKDEDLRDYRVSFSKIRNELGFEIGRTVPDGIREIKEIIQKGIIQDPENQKYYNILHRNDERKD